MGQLLLAKQKPTSSVSTKLIRPLFNTSDQERHEESETVITEDITTLGAPTKLVRTLTQIGKHMNEAVEVKFDDEDECDGSDVPVPVFTEEINTHGGAETSCMA